MAPREVLVTGFEPFDGEAVNPSQEVVRRLEGWRDDVHGLVLPVEFERCVERLDDALQRLRPAIVVALGQAATRAEFAVERIAVNLDDARLPDNAGRQPVDTPVIAGAPMAYLSTLPVKHIVGALRAAGVPASVSLSAGSYVCNHLFFALAHRIAGGQGPQRGGFIHLPCLPEQAVTVPGRPSMALETLVAGVKLAVDVSRRP